MKRAIRLLWVLGVNGAVIWFMYSQKVSGSLVLLLKATVPILGIVVELVGWRFARWVNVGYLALLSLYWCGGAAYWHSDPFFGVLLIIGVGFLILTGLTDRVYHYTSPE
jgi:hypothetical protein